MWAVILGLIVATLTALRKTAVVKTVTGLISTAFMWAFHGLRWMFPKEASIIAKTITETYYTPVDEWADFVSKYIANLTGDVVDVDTIKKLGASVAGQTLMEGIGKTFLEPMLGLIMPTPEELKANPKGGAHRFMATNLQFQLNAWLLHLLGDMMSFGVFKSLKDLPNAISWSYGIGWLSWLVMGTPFRIAISDPLEKYFNDYYRAAIPTVTQLLELKKRFPEAGWYYDIYLHRHGLDDHWIEDLYKLQGKDPTTAELKALYEEGMITQEYVKYYMQIRGFDPGEAELLTVLLCNSRAMGLRDELVKEAIRLYEDGLLDQPTLRTYLLYAHYNEWEQHYVIDACHLRMKRRAQFSDSEIINLYEKYLLTKEEALRKLTSRGWSREDAEKLLMKNRPLLTWAQLKVAVEKGLATREDVLDIMLEAGWDRRQAEIYLEL